MNDEQEALVRFLFGQIRKVRAELDVLYCKKKKLEYLTDHLYISGLDDLWLKGNTQLAELYNIILDRYGVIKNLEIQLLNSALGETNPIKIIKPLESKE